MTPIKWISLIWGSFLVFIGTWFFLLPCFITSYYLVTDKGLRGDGVSTFALSSHKKLSKRYQRYTTKRVASGKAVEARSVSSTEWPLFGSMFYLIATAELQKSWEADPSISKVAPKVYAKETIEAAKNLVLDENHATWVKHYWGKDNYLNSENVFYRMLIMWSIICHHDLTDSREHLPLLKEQAESLLSELNASAHGLLDDYPRQCYPTDIVAALAAIRQSDRILGTDNDQGLAYSFRGFSGRLAEPLGLPPYGANSRTGQRYDNSRGCGNSYFCTFGPLVWPEHADSWYPTYVSKFWQDHWFTSGFREFLKKDSDEFWYFDVDAGPVLGGIGFAASAFGVAAARTNSDFERSYTLASEMIAYSGPLLNGTMLLPRILSDKDHAPFLGEMAIIYQLSIRPVLKTSIPKGEGNIPGCVWILLLIQLSFGSLVVWRGSKRVNAKSLLKF